MGGKNTISKINPEIASGMGKRIADYIGLKKESLPAVWILDTRSDMKKYIMQGPIEEKNIVEKIL